ncbi:MAG: hypothetical protein O7I93_03860 [Gemmatimonadetes bacterium]|nr:hypothetical protein [Gemmatimonadota bacterium]
MILALPWASWLLLVVAVGLGLTFELLFYSRRRDVRRQGNVRHPTDPE